MKKNPIQYITLFLCAILLPLTIIQSVRLEQYRIQLGSEFHSLENRLSSTLDAIRYDVRNELEQSSQPMDYYDISLGAIDFESRTVQLGASVSLKQWSEDSLVTLVIDDGALRKTIQMTTDGTGTFSTTLSVPLEEAEGFRLEAMVTTGGISTSMELGDYSDIYSLLPLRSTSSGWTGPEYVRGMLVLDYDYSLEWTCDQPGTISNARFNIYVNDDLLRTMPATEASNLNFRISPLEVECGENDTVRLEFCCEDSFGIGYIFTCMEYVLEDGTVTESVGLDATEFYWVTEAENCDH